MKPRYIAQYIDFIGRLGANVRTVIPTGGCDINRIRPRSPGSTRRTRPDQTRLASTSTGSRIVTVNHDHADAARKNIEAM